MPTLPTTLLTTPPAVDALSLAHGSGLVETVDGLVENDRRHGTVTALLILAADARPEECPDTPEQPLQNVVARLRAGTRAGDTWFALDERHAAVVLTALPPAAAEGVVERVTDTLLVALELSELTCPDRVGVRVSIGASLALLRAHDGRETVQQAVDALAVARADGGHCARIRTLG
ncbi:hypothetical protein ACFFKU_17280 [Kineococcus gynurae]|uniref:GGDEF domain-containing protein n=1 Tax=Kineococcus gynurae TaxID=452979 RepID=A0ABV5LNW2_9ACTN